MKTRNSRSVGGDSDDFRKETSLDGPAPEKVR